MADFTYAQPREWITPCEPDAAFDLGGVASPDQTPETRTPALARPPGLALVGREHSDYDKGVSGLIRSPPPRLVPCGLTLVD